PNFSVSDVTQVEGTLIAGGFADFTFTLSLSQPTTVPVTVAYATADGSALAAFDYLAANGYLTFYPGQTSKTAVVQVDADVSREVAETFTLRESAVGTWGVGAGARAEA